MRLRDGLIVFWGGLGVYCLLKARDSSPSSPNSVPLPNTGPNTGPNTTPNQQPAQRVHHPLGGDNLPLVPGMWYFAAVSVGFPASVAASVSAIRKLAAERGFVNVDVVEETRPPWWPGRLTKTDYFIRAEYRGQPTMLSRKPGPGVEVLEAFVL